jgi:glycerol-3-phosphate acyltransferase PlsY
VEPMTVVLAEVSDKIGTGYEPGYFAMVVGGLIVPLAWWWRFVPILLTLVVCALGNVVIASEINTWIGVAIVDEIGWSYYVRSFVAWNLPLTLTAALVPLVHRRSMNSTRARRGQCIQCGYDLRGNMDQGCPECGWGRKK